MTTETMDKVDVSLKPPAPRAKAVLLYRKTLEAERDGLREGAAELALAAARGDTEAKAALAAVPARFAALQFEIDLNAEAYDLAHKLDADAETAWRAAIQTLPPAEIVRGITAESCCGRCLPGIAGGCVITASAPYAGPTCGHPVKEKHLFHRDARGRRIFPYSHSPQAASVFAAACDRLKVREEFEI